MLADVRSGTAGADHNRGGSDDVNADRVDQVDQVDVPCGHRVVVVSGLRLGGAAEQASMDSSSAVARRLETWTGPGTLILAGETFQLSGQPNNSPARALAAHPRLAAALERFVATAGRVFVLPAGSDATLLDREPDDRPVMGAGPLAIHRSVDLCIHTGVGDSRVRVVGCSPTETMDDVAQASDTFYSRLQRWLWVPLAGPVLVVAAMWLLRSLAVRHNPRLTPPVAGLAYVVFSIVTVQFVATVLLVWRLGSQRARRVSEPDLNRDARAVAADACGIGGTQRGLVAGVIGGPGSTAELIDLGPGWFAHPGRSGSTATKHRSRFGLPDVFVASSVVSWIEMEAGADLHVRVVEGCREERPATWIARRLARSNDLPVVPAQVAELAPGVVWPTPMNPLAARESTRRRASAFIAVCGALNVLSAVTPPFSDRLSLVRHVIPVGVPALAAGLALALGLGLMVLSGGLRRGRRVALRLCIAALFVSAAAHIVKGIDVEEAAVAVVLGAWLISHGDAFLTPVPVRRVGRSAIVVGGVLVATWAAATVGLHIAARTGITSNGLIVLERFVAIPSGQLPEDTRFLAFALPMIGIGSLLSLVLIAFRPRAVARLDDRPDPRAWDLVRRYGRGTLDYFALRDDKRHFIVEDTVVPYAVVQGTAVVAPDPIGPADQRVRAWAAFREHCVANGWRVAVLAAHPTWLPIYHASGMTSMYIGDESVVDVRRFTLDGGRRKSLRQAVNRMATAGYVVEFGAPGDLDETTRRQLREIATRSRRGLTERGFSMTLSRLFDPRDDDLLIAVARAADGRPVAFCQYVPAPGINGYSLDIMRRDDPGTQHDSPDRARVDTGALPNGINELLVVRTIEYLRTTGFTGLCLHFATMRAVLAGDTDHRFRNRAIASMMQRLGDRMQIESLWRFNAKFEPDWAPRYLVLDHPASGVHAALAVANVESLWELPLIGRLLRPVA